MVATFSELIAKKRLPLSVLVWTLKELKKLQAEKRSWVGESQVDFALTLARILKIWTDPNYLDIL